MKPLEVTEERVLFFRARRGHLAGAGAPDPASAARSIVGAQAQQLAPALHALSLRTAGRPTAAAITAAIMRAPRSLVWTWGQRGTLHVYCSKTDWACVVGARGDWGIDGRGGPVPTPKMLVKALAVVRKSDRAVTRGDMVGVAPKSYVAALAERAAAANMDAERLAASRLIWKLAQLGDLCLGENVGTERSYPARADWHPKLQWPNPEEPPNAATTLARRYLKTYGAATPQDVAHFFGARVSSAKSWLASMSKDLVPVDCGARKGLIALAEDVDDLRSAVPRGASEWPLRLLPLWESVLMAHADKSWTVPEETERRAVWRKAAFVAAVVLARGRVVATWTQKKRSKHVAVDVEPLSGWKRSYGAAVKREAQALAAHLGLEEARVTLP